MSFRRLLCSFISSSSSSSCLNPLSKYTHRYCPNHWASSLLYFTTVSSPEEPSENSLFIRLLRVSNTNDSISLEFNKWIGEGRPIYDDDVRKLIKLFRKYKRFDHALQISARLKTNLRPGDVAVQLDLISKVHGLEEAEKFFNSLPDKSKLIQIYGSLLKCYADAKAIDKAEAHMEKMKKLGFARTLSYNVMLDLYYKMGDLVKFNSLVQEMEDKGIFNDQFTYNFRLNAYSAASDIVGMEKLLMKMEADPFITIDWAAYAVAADGYLKIGSLEKAKMVLKKFEQLIRGRSIGRAYSGLISLYTRLGMKDEIYRIWKKQRNSSKFYNTIYISLISSLAKLDDIVGAENLLEEWEGKTIVYDSRVPHTLLFAYCKNGDMDKAESVISGIIERGNEPRAITWSCMALGYINSNQNEKAVDMLEKAIATSYHTWEPDIPTLAQCLEYLDCKGDVDRAKDIVALLEERGKFSVEFRDRLERYRKNEKLEFYEKLEFSVEFIDNPYSYSCRILSDTSMTYVNEECE